MVKFYHITGLGSIGEIFSGRQSGLRPSRRMIDLGVPKIPSQGHEGAIFGTLNSNPEEWWRNTWVPNTPLMETVLKDIDTGGTDQVVLLEVDTENNNDQIFVADWGVHLIPEYTGRKSGNLSEVKQRYVNSLTPIEEYMSSGQSFEVPEVICFRDIPAHQLNVVGTYERYPLIDQKRKEPWFLQPRPDPFTKVCI